MSRITTLVVASVALAGAISASPAAAHPNLVAEAKKAGMPAQNCQYCHVSKTPSKSTYKPEDLNDRGKWMMTEKEKKQAKAVMADWLKDYPGGKEQK